MTHDKSASGMWAAIEVEKARKIRQEQLIQGLRLLGCIVLKLDTNMPNNMMALKDANGKIHALRTKETHTEPEYYI